MRASLAVSLILALGPPVPASSAAPRPNPTGTSAAAFRPLHQALERRIDRGEGYLHQGRKVSLLRERGRALVQLRAGEDPDFARRLSTALGRAFAFRRLPVGSSDGGAAPAQLLELDLAASLSPSQADSAAAWAGESLPSVLSADPAVRYARPVYVEAGTGRRIAPTDRIAVRLAKPAPPGLLAAVEKAAGAKSAGPAGSAGEDIWLLALGDAKADPLEASARAAALPGVAWAEPEFRFPLERHFIPDDPFFINQQHLKNTGHNFATAGADVSAAAAWDYTLGDTSITIAVIDDGVQTSHPDLRIKPGGRNFYPNTPTTNPNPTQADENHGTMVAGVAAARGNNALGGSGMAPSARVLPLKIAQAGQWALNSNIARAIRYAVDTGGADVLNNSWGGGTPNGQISAAILHASLNGRAGRGALVIFSAGNAASAYEAKFYPLWQFTPPIPAGRYRVAFRYAKNGSGTGGEDLASVDNYAIRSSDGYTLAERETFAAGLPAGWTAVGGNLAWIATTGMHYGGTGDNTSLRSPAGMANGQAAEIRAPLRTFDPGEVLQLMVKVSSAANDTFSVRLYDSAGALVGETAGLDGIPAAPLDSVSYPAMADSAVAVGASTELDYRSGYSQYRVSGSGRTVAFLAPSNGAWNGIVTTDRTGADGVTAGDYTFGFGGTSASAPLASGVAALILSRHPSLTRTQLLQTLKATCDPIGGVTYVNGQHREYGHGRLNARRALAALDSPPALANPGNKSVDEGQRLSFDLAAADPDGDTPIFSGLDLPAGASLSGSTFTWTPGFTQTGNYSLRLVAATHALSDTESIVITVGNVNGPPDIAAIADTAINEGQSLGFPVTAVEPDGEPVTWSWSGGPPGATFQGGAFAFTPTFADSGVYNLRFVATSGSLSDTEHVRLTVIDVNRRPVLTVPGSRTVAESRLLDFTVSATDPDGDNVLIVTLALPDGAAFDGSRFLWRPRFDQAGDYSVRFYAVSGGLIDSQDVAITVTDGGTGVGALRLRAAPGTEFLVMPAADGPGDPLGRDSVLFTAGVGTYWFTARRAGYRALRFPIEVSSDTVWDVPVALKPHVPWQAGPAIPLLLDGGPLAGLDAGAVAVDLDYDGKQDLVAAGPAGPRFLRNVAATDEAEGLYSASADYAFLPAAFAGLHAFTADDWDNDGYYDLLLARAGGRLLRVRLAAPLPGTTAPVYGDTAVLLERPGKSCHPRVADRDGDRLKDLWLVCAEDGVWIYRNTGSDTAPALGAAPIEVRGPGGAVLSGLASPVWMDADGNGDDDLLAFQGGRLKVFPGQPGPDGAYSLLAPRELNVAGAKLDCADCRLALRPGADGMAYLLSFQPGRGAVAHRSRLLGDLTGDGKADAADRQLLLGAWERRDTDPDWNPALNLALDPDRFERIDIRDLGAFGDSWGLEE